MTQRAPEISVVVPVLNEAHRIAACLDCLAAQRDAPSFEVLIVDNGSTDETAGLAGRHRIGPTILREPARGPYAARNAGIRAARGRVIAFTDADCSPEPGWLAAGFSTLEDGADLAGGRIVQTVRDRPTLWERYDAAMYLDQDLHVATEGFAATANLFVGADVFERVGGFRPELVASGDVEFGRRATRAGYRLVFCEATVRHRPRATLRETWALHRKLGSGFAELARAGLRPSAWRDPALRVPLGWVSGRTGRNGAPLRRRELAGVHAVAMAARWVGRLTGHA